MNNHHVFRAVAAWAAIASAPIAYATIVYGLRAVEWNFATFEDPMSSLFVGRDGSPLIHLSMIADMLGYYLFLIPVAIYLWQWLRRERPGLATVYSTCGLFYILIGAIGASILAAVHPPLIDEYAVASGTRRETIELLFRTTMDLVYGGLWNMLEVTLAGIWWIGLGAAIRSAHRTLGTLTMILGAAGLIDGFGTMIGSTAVSMVGLPVYIVLAPLWAFVMGIAILRGFGSEPVEQVVAVNVRPIESIALTTLRN